MPGPNDRSNPMANPRGASSSAVHVVAQLGEFMQKLAELPLTESNAVRLQQVSEGALNEAVDVALELLSMRDDPSLSTSERESLESLATHLPKALDQREALGRRAQPQSGVADAGALPRYLPTRQSGEVSVTTPLSEASPKFNAYLTALRDGQTHAGDLEIYALAHALKRPIVVANVSVVDGKYQVDGHRRVDAQHGGESLYLAKIAPRGDDPGPLYKRLLNVKSDQDLQNPKTVMTAMSSYTPRHAEPNTLFYQAGQAATGHGAYPYAAPSDAQLREITTGWLSDHAETIMADGRTVMQAALDQAETFLAR